MNTFGLNRTCALRPLASPAPTRGVAAKPVPGTPAATDATIPSAPFREPLPKLMPRRSPMQRMLFALFLALALLLASLPARAGVPAPLAAGQYEGLLGISLALFAAVILGRVLPALVRARTGRRPGRFREE